MTIVGRDGQIRLIAKFYEYDGGLPYDATESNGHPKLEIYFNSILKAGPFLYSDGAGPVQRDNLGVFSYSYTVPADAELGDWRASWTGTIHGTPVYGEEFFEVTVVGDIITGPGSNLGLGVDYILTFTSGVSPLYIDPEEIQIIFPDAPYIDVLELIHKYSLEIDDIRGINDVTDQMLDYIYAATACSLSKIYGGLGSIFGDESAVVLGDLSVTSKSRPRTAANVTTGNYGSWCELAYALRNNLIRGSAIVKPYVRGSHYRNPIPRRDIRRTPHGIIRNKKCY